MIRVERRDGVAVVHLEHGKVNALDLELLRAATATVRDLSSASAVVLTGRGTTFSAGVDLGRVLDGSPGYAAELIPAIGDAALALFDHPRPVVAAINGHAIAGGCVLAVACDLRLMSGGRIGVTELLVGVPFPTVPLEIVRHAAGTATDELVLTGRLLDPEAARECGLVHQMVATDGLLDEAVRRAGELARIPGDVYAATKAQLHRPTRERIAAGAADDERVRASWQSPEVLAAMRRFLGSLDRRSA
ncbi:MAG: enoyl-CoA hydratase [Chloroflexota bacterium]|nr:enoyl-CoA hydratase [Chloroflexota bacterium]